MKKLIIFLVMVLCALQLPAQPPGRFNPKKFQADLEQHIVVRAGLTPKEAAEFFPLYREMQNKQRALSNQLRTYRHVDTNNDRECLQAIKKADNIEIEIKKIQRDYHQRFCKVLSPGKVMKVIKADRRFHRQAFKKAAKRDRAFKDRNRK